jgi:hypothetical protein
MAIKLRTPGLAHFGRQFSITALENLTIPNYEFLQLVRDERTNRSAWESVTNCSHASDQPCHAATCAAYNSLASHKLRNNDFTVIIVVDNMGYSKATLIDFMSLPEARPKFYFIHNRYACIRRFILFILSNLFVILIPSVDPGGFAYDTVKDFVENFTGWALQSHRKGNTVFVARRPRPDVILSAYDAAEHTDYQPEVEARDKTGVTVFTDLVRDGSMEFVEKPMYLASFRGRCTNREVSLWFFIFIFYYYFYMRPSSDALGARQPSEDVY